MLNQMSQYNMFNGPISHSINVQLANIPFKKVNAPISHSIKVQWANIHIYISDTADQGQNEL